MRRLIPVLLISIIVLSAGFGGCLSLITGEGGDLGRVTGVMVKETTTYLGLSWEPVEGADHYQVYRDDVVMVETSRLFYNDSGVIAGEDYSYRICGVKRSFLSTVQGPLSELVWGNLTQIEHNDPGFRAFDTDCHDLIIGKGYDFEEAGNAWDLGRITSLCQELESLSNSYLQESYLFELTPELQLALDEFRWAMEDLITGCQLAQEGVDHLSEDEIYEGMDYISMGLEHLQNSVDLL